MEVELKLLLAPEDNDRLLKHPLIGGEGRTQRLAARYFDTPDLHLLRHGAGLRVRKVDGEWIQTMKAGGSVQSGLHSRNEWECPIDRSWPRLGKLRKLVGDDAPWRAMLDARDLKERLEPLFLVDVTRQLWDLEVDGSHIEVALDHGHIERHGKRVAINELELELKEGQPASLYAFALHLLEDIPLRISNVNKAQRGYMLVREVGVAPCRAQSLDLPHDASIGDAQLAILGNCLQHIQNNETAVIEGTDPETLHQMRVGVRRLRSALKLFDAVAPCPPGLAEDVQWLGDQLGAARDWDVLVTSTLPRADVSAAGGNALMDLQALVLETSHAKRRLAAEALLSTRYTKLMLTLGSWMLQTAPLLSGSAASFSRQTLQQLHGKMLKRAKRMNDDDPVSAHRTRIAAKRARYALEFFHALYRPKSVRAYLKNLSATQDELGRHNDLVMAARMLQALAREHPQAAGEIQFARGYLLARESAQPADLDAIRGRLHHLRLPHASR
ncbi:CYTH and CHAD domain-containing protein [Duganella callida]|uniref:CYTH and CHAD domain-containing protein n=1 Tax=Duganella callida TaxID=2561932 RepID=A0A4Y9SUY8_9BURK|nr:CYTH and CHAD domain-containing protein [Duganella callida]TFW29024.1 CYTH and CHAD domain-containing protein [Duganella callida]